MAVLVVVMISASLVAAVTFPGAAGGLSWLVTLGVAALAVATQPLPLPALLRLRWLLASIGLASVSLLWTPQFTAGLQSLAQLTILPLCYIVGWRLSAADANAVRTLSTAALWTMPLAVVVFVRSWFSGSFQFGWLVGNAARPMVIAMAILFIVGTIGRSRRVALAAGGFGLFVAFASGGRMGFAVIALLIIVSPAVGLQWRTRIALAVVGLLALSFAVQTDAFQDRFFVGRDTGTLSDILFLRGNFNTAGRADNWPAIVEACSENAILGTGIGATGLITLTATNGVTDHPHNEFIRTYCDLGVVGSIAFWLFFAAAGWRGFRSWWRRKSESRGSAQFQIILALFAFALTDNPLVYTSAFMAPALMVLGMSGARLPHERRQQSPARPMSLSEIT